MKSKSAPLVALALMVLLPALAWSEPRPTGSEFRVNRSTGAQHRNSAAAFEAGGTRALVVWQNDMTGLRARFVGRDGSPLGDELGLVANTSIPGLPFQGEVTTRKEPSVGFLPSGDFLLAWTEERAHLSAGIFYEHRTVLDRDVLVQRFTAAGTPLGEPARINADTAGFQSAPKLLVRRGGAVVVWESNDRAAGSEGDGIFGRLVTALGQPSGEQFRVKPEGGGAMNAAIAGDGAGRFTVVWEAADGGTKGVFARLFDASARPVGGEVRVNTRVAGLQRRPGITAAGDRGWLVVWQGQVGPRTNSQIFGQFLGETGNHVGPNFRVSNDDYETRISPSVARLAGGGFLVVWMDWKGVFPAGLTGVALDLLGNTTSEEVAINTRPIDAHHRTSLAASAAGDVLVSWEGFAPGQQRSGIEARFFRAE